MKIELLNNKAVLKSTDRNDILDYLILMNVVNYFTTFFLKLPVNNDVVLDYIQEIWLLICSIDLDKWNELKNYIVPYVILLIKKNCISTTSKAYYNTKKMKDKEYYMSEELWTNFNEYGILPRINDENNGY